MDVVDRFCSYISFDTQSDENSTSCPSAEKEKRLAEALVQELQCLGLTDARMDSYGYVYARLNATAILSSVTTILATAPPYPRRKT